VVVVVVVVLCKIQKLELVIGDTAAGQPICVIVNNSDTFEKTIN